MMCYSEQNVLLGCFGENIEMLPNHKKDFE